MKLNQGQVWKNGDEYIRIVKLERLKVAYKSQMNLATRDGPHHETSQKEFCRLIKNATLVPLSEIPKREEE